MVKKARDFVREERQKEVTDKYRDNWDKIFNKKKNHKKDQEKS